MTTVHEGTNHFPEMQSLNYQRLPAEEQLRRAFSFLQTVAFAGAGAVQVS
jgi:hypothetical protein